VKLFKSILIGLAALLALLVVVGLFLDDHYRVERSVVIDADPGAIHEVLGDLARWSEWTPWEDEDPSIVNHLGERTTGVGASQTWTANSGDGRLEFTASSPLEGVAFDVWFGNEAAPHESALLYSAAGAATRVTWSMEGDMGTPVIGGYFARLADGMMGPMFERGLEKLRRLVESERQIEQDETD